MATRRVGWKRLALGTPEAEAPAPAPQPDAQAVPEIAVARIDFGVEMAGRYVVNRPVEVLGEFRGELETTSSVLVCETGAVEAPIRARAVEIHGAVVGDVVASREVVIHATGRLHGDVETPCLVIARGAYFNGRTRMYRPERTRQSDAPEPVPPLG
jgi:cytoskeletal protein CcmA (bactofilin family)